MIDALTQEKIKQFLNDKAMSDAVREFMESAILKSKGQRDVYVLAAERIALDVLKEAWLDMQRLKGSEEKQEDKKNVGI